MRYGDNNNNIDEVMCSDGLVLHNHAILNISCWTVTLIFHLQRKYPAATLPSENPSCSIYPLLTLPLPHSSPFSYQAEVRAAVGKG